MKKKLKDKVCGRAKIVPTTNGYSWIMWTSAVYMNSAREFSQKVNCKRSLIHFAEKYGIDILNFK